MPMAQSQMNSGRQYKSPDQTPIHTAAGRADDCLPKWNGNMRPEEAGAEKSFLGATFQLHRSMAAATRTDPMSHCTGYFPDGTSFPDTTTSIRGWLPWLNSKQTDLDSMIWPGTHGSGSMTGTVQIGMRSRRRTIRAGRLLEIHGSSEADHGATPLSSSAIPNVASPSPISGRPRLDSVVRMTRHDKSES